jgi:hypothetical protein
MGKSSGAQQVNSNIQGQLSGLQDKNNPLNSLMQGQQGYLNTQQGRDTDLYNNAIGNFNSLGGGNAGSMMGNGVFGDLANTGGFSDADKANYRARATSNVPAFFSGVHDQLQNQNRVNHGMNAGYTAQMSKLARDQGQASQNATMNAEGSLHDMINQGKLAGASGLQRGAEGLNQFSLGKQGLANQMYGMGQSGVNSGFSNLLSGLGMKQADINQLLQLQSGRNSNDSGLTKFLSPILGAGGSLLGGLTSLFSSKGNQDNGQQSGGSGYGGGSTNW